MGPCISAATRVRVPIQKSTAARRIVKSLGAAATNMQEKMPDVFAPATVSRYVQRDAGRDVCVCVCVCVL